MKVEIVLPNNAKTWNVFLRANIWKYRQHVKEVHSEVEAYCYAQHRNVTLSAPVSVTFVHGYKDKRRRDIDSVCIKPHVDAIVNAGIIPDDNKEIINKVIHIWEKTESPQTRIIVKERLKS